MPGRGSQPRIMYSAAQIRAKATTPPALVGTRFLNQGFVLVTNQPWSRATNTQKDCLCIMFAARVRLLSFILFRETANKLQSRTPTLPSTSPSLSEETDWVKALLVFETVAFTFVLDLRDAAGREVSPTKQQQT